MFIEKANRWLRGRKWSKKTIKELEKKKAEPYKIKRILISERTIRDKPMLTIDNLNSRYGLDIKKILQIEKDDYSFNWEIFYQ